MKPDPQVEILQCLRCAAGHLNTIIEMAEAGEPCEQLLHKLKAVRSALRAARIKVLHCQMQASGKVILSSASCEARMAELRRLQSLYRLFTQYFIPNTKGYL